MEKIAAKIMGEKTMDSNRLSFSPKYIYLKLLFWKEWLQKDMIRSEKVAASASEVKVPWPNQECWLGKIGNLTLWQK